MMVRMKEQEAENSLLKKMHAAPLEMRGSDHATTASRCFGLFLNGVAEEAARAASVKNR